MVLRLTFIDEFFNVIFSEVFMKLKFSEWIKKRPSDLSAYYLKQSNVALVVSVMFFIFVLAYKWWNNPLLIVRSP